MSVAPLVNMANKKKKKTSSKKGSAAKSVAPKWKSSSKDGKKLTKLIKSGEISQGMTPALVRETYPRFKKYDAGAFRSALRRTRMAEGQFLRANKEADSSDDDDDDDDDDMAELCSTTSSDDERDDLKLPTIPAPRIHSASIPGGSPDAAASLLLVQMTAEWKPLHFMTVRTSGDLTQAVSFTLVLPSGIGEATTDDIDLSLANGGNGKMKLVVVVTWPKYVADLQFLKQFRPFLSTEDFVLLGLAYKKKLAELRAANGGKLQSCAEFDLPVRVNPTIKDEDWKFLGHSTCRLLDVQLKVPSATQYADKAVKRVGLMEEEEEEDE